MRLFGKRRGPRTESTEVDISPAIDAATLAVFDVLVRAGIYGEHPFAELTTEGQRGTRAIAAAAVRAAAPRIIEDTTRATCAAVGVKLHGFNVRHANEADQ